MVRGKLLSLREEDFVMAGKIAGATAAKIIPGHLVPSFLSYVTVALTLSVPSMILAETSLSFLGLGLRPPVVSWGVLPSEAQNIHTVGLAPWLLIPGCSSSLPCWRSTSSATARATPPTPTAR